MMTIDTNFPGGNLRVFESRDDILNVAPDYRDSEGGWFYWAFRVTGAAGRTLHVHFRSPHVGARGPAISTDGRLSWRWTAEPFGNDFFQISIPQGCDEIYLAFAPLYTQENLDRFVATLPAGTFSREVLTLSRKGREVELLRFGAAPEKAKHHILATARHHCCEMIADYVLEGFMAYFASGQARDAQWLRDYVSLAVVPFADKDGVEDGDQGKNRIPHDHARDYGRNDPIYPETKAISALVRDAINAYGKLDLVMDVHCPWIRGNENEDIYMVGKDLPNDAVFRRKFGRLIEMNLPRGSLPYQQKNDIPFGVSWNTAKNYTKGATLPGWAGKLLGVKAAASFEIPYANAGGAVVSAESSRLFGQGLAKAVAGFLRKTAR